MFEAHPFLTLVGILFLFISFCTYADIYPDTCGAYVLIIIVVWIFWALNIPDTPQEIEQKRLARIEQEENARVKAIPRILSEKDGCTIYVFERERREHFFTRCEKTTSTETNWTESCGKSCRRDMKDTIVTPNK